MTHLGGHFVQSGFSILSFLVKILLSMLAMCHELSKMLKMEGQVLGIFLYQFIFIFLCLWLFIKRFISLFILIFLLIFWAVLDH